jgi:von Willebrand factor type A domain
MTQLGLLMGSGKTDKQNGEAKRGETMDRNISLRQVHLAGLACTCMVLLSLACNTPPPVGGTPGAGGARGDGQGGNSTSTGPATGGSGSGGIAGSTIVINMDAPVAWPGSADASQVPDDTLSLPTIDSNCGNITSRTTRQPVDVLLVLDRSGSMDYSIAQDCYCAMPTGTQYGSLCADTTNCTTRWNAVKPAVATTLSNASYVNWGLKFFPSAGANTSCIENSTIDVPITPTSASDVQSQVDNAKYEYSTPTAMALSAATAYLKTLNDGNQKFILLATDGEPNCGGTPANVNTDDLAGANKAAAAALAAGFKVYVIGIGPNLDNLTQLAQNGGTTNFYQVSSPQDLGNALSSISKLVGSCDFTFTPASSDAATYDEGNVGVYVNGNRVDKDPNNGWTFGSSTQEIVLTGDYCAQMSSGNQADVQILFGCPGQTSFPSTIY